MVLSICIPVYNYVVADLFSDLIEQADARVEIIFLDDGSNPDFQEQNQQFFAAQVGGNWSYDELSQNVGRTLIRKKLAEVAQGEHVLFLDCDVRVFQKDFVTRYLAAMEAHPSAVIVGGRTYPRICDRGFEIHFYYGTRVETKTAKQRSEGQFIGFQSNNFALPKTQFGNILPKITLEGYGHEDTLMGFEIQMAKIPMVHIENPVFHEGLDGNEGFLKKSEEGVRNLKVLANEARYSAMAHQQIRLLKWVKRLSPFAGLLKSEGSFELIERKLKQTYSPGWFQVWKLAVYFRLK